MKKLRRKKWKKKNLALKALEQFSTVKLERTQIYLDRWKAHQKDESKPWKFKTNLEVYLTKHIFNPEKFSGKYFRTGRKYLKKMKGRRRQVMVTRCKQEIGEPELDSEGEELPPTRRCRRAKKILEDFKEDADSSSGDSD